MTKETDRHDSVLFFKFTPGEDCPQIRKRLAAVKAVGIHNIIASYEEEGLKETRLGGDYFETIKELAEACRKEEIGFWLEDYAPFPTGSANGAYREKEYAHLNKLYIDERHLDMRGPVKDAMLRVDLLQNVTYGIARTRFAKVDPDCRRRLGVVAYRVNWSDTAEFSPSLEDGSAVCLDEFIRDGYLHWDIPEGYWRIFVLFTTYEGAGRPYYMNLLSRESVALEIERIHMPVYETLKPWLNQSWKGFFYDEPEIGNAGSADVFDFFMLPGRRTREKTDCNVYPWSPEMPKEMENREKDWIQKLPILWYDGQEEHREIRLSYMDAVTSLVRENYNGQVYDFCHKRGVGYMGHVLEDEGSHVRLGCGPGHYFRQQYYQDEAGIDVIAGQILPGRDGAASWYGVTNANGEFYHYGLAKLASSEAYINPLKRNRCMCETFAMYGKQGLSQMKFLVDHLMVNGINRILFADLSSPLAPVDCPRMLGEYTDRMCSLLRSAEPVMETAVLYHAEAEWMDDQAQGFQVAARELARNQISYDVIPADVFTFPERYQADFDEGLSVNGHTYRALIVPSCRTLPESARKFLEECVKTHFPVFFLEQLPKNADVKERDSFCHVVSTAELAKKVRSRIKSDFSVEETQGREWLRVLHLRKDGKDIYLLHNEAPDDEVSCRLRLSLRGPVLREDPMSGLSQIPIQAENEDGSVSVELTMGRYEMCMLRSMEAADKNTGMYARPEKLVLKGDWTVEMADGTRLEGNDGSLPEPEKVTGREFFGKLVYRAVFDASGDLPKLLDLGRVSDCCQVSLNGCLLGERISAPYLFDVEHAIREGENLLEIEVYTGADNLRLPVRVFDIPLDALTAAPYTLVDRPGLRGPVRGICIKQMQAEKERRKDFGFIY